MDNETLNNTTPPTFKKSWFLQPWLICILCAFWVCIIPGIIGIFLLIAYYVKDSKQQQEYESYLGQLFEELSHCKDGTAELKRKLNYADATIASKEHETEDEREKRVKFEQAHKDNIAALKEELRGVEAEIFDAQLELRTLNKTITAAHYGFTDLESISTPEYKNKLGLLKLEEQELVESREAFSLCPENTEKKTIANMKQIVRCFNAECNNVFIQLTEKNIDSSRNKIFQSFSSLNSIYEVDGIMLDEKMLALKLDELVLHYKQKKDI